MAWAERGALRVPGVDELYRRPDKATPSWEADRQIARWARAAVRRSSTDVAILDGDVLRPAWAPLADASAELSYAYAVLRIFRAREAELRLPDRIVVVQIDEPIRHIRDIVRGIRRGRLLEMARREAAANRMRAASLAELFKELESAFPALIHRTADLDPSALNSALAAMPPHKCTVPAMLDHIERRLRRLGGDETKRSAELR